MSLDPTENLVNTDVLSALCTDLAKVCRVKVIAPCAAITLVGRGMRSMLHRLSGVLAEFGPLRVHLISQSSNNLNLTFVVDEEVAADLVPRLHALLIQAEAMRVEDAAVFGPSWRDLYSKRTVGAGRSRGGARAATNCSTLAASGTPRYVYDLATRARARAGAARVIGASIAGSTRSRRMRIRRCCAKLRRQGFGLECVSPGELDAREGIAAADAVPLLFTPNFAAREEYAAALRARRRRDASTTCIRWRIGARCFADAN